MKSAFEKYIRSFAEVCMNRKKTVNWVLSFMMVFSTMLSDVTVYAEGEEETAEPVIEEVTEIEETAEPEVTEIVSEMEISQELIETSEAEEKTESAISSQENDNLSGISIDESLDEEGTEGFELQEAVVDFFKYYIYDFDNQYGIITGYTGSDTEVVIPEKLNGNSIKRISSTAFMDNTVIKSVVIPGSIELIGGNAFSGCSNLSSVTISEGVLEIEDNTKYMKGAFSNCNALTEIELPSTLTRIGSNAFLNCKGLQSVTVAGGIVGTSAFEGCTGLISATLSDNVTDIETYAFRNCSNLTTVKLSNGLTCLNNGIFSGCKKLQTIEIPGTITELKSDVFTGAGLTEVILHEGLEIIGIGAFQGCDLESIVIPNTVTTIMGSAFNGCNFSYIRIPEGITAIAADCFLACGSLETVVLPSTLTAIEYEAFKWCHKLKSIIIPEGVTYIGAGAFQECESLVSVTIPDSVNTIGQCAFSWCESLKSITIPEGVTELPDGTAQNTYYGVFNDCYQLETVNLPSTLTKLGTFTFQNCTSLKTISIPKSVTDFGEKPSSEIYAPFYGCSNLKTVYYDGTMNEWIALIHEELGYLIGEVQVVNSNGDYVFNPPSDFSFKFNSTDKTYTITEYHGNDAEITIPDERNGHTVTKIKDTVFNNNVSLISVKIPDTIASISKNLFTGCTGLSIIYYDVSKDEWISMIEEDLGSYVGMATLVNSAGEYVLNPPTDYRFKYNSVNKTYSIEKYKGAGQNIILPYERNDYPVTTISSSAFYNDDNLVSVTIPEEITRIEEFAFENCSNLVSISIPAEVTMIGLYAFNYCDKLTDIYYGGSEEGWNTLTKSDIGIDDSVTVHYGSGSSGVVRDGIILSDTQLHMNYISQTKTLYATPKGDASGKKLVFSSSNESVVSFTGLEFGNSRILISNGTGTAVITVATEDGSYSASAEVTVANGVKHFGRMTNVNTMTSSLRIDGETFKYQFDSSYDIYLLRIRTVYSGNYSCNEPILYYTNDGKVVEMFFLEEVLGNISEYDSSIHKLKINNDEYTIDDETVINDDLAFRIEKGQRVKLYLDNRDPRNIKIAQLTVIDTGMGAVDTVTQENGTWHVSIGDQGYQVLDRETAEKLQAAQGKTVLFTMEDAKIYQVFNESEIEMTVSLRINVDSENIRYGVPKAVYSISEEPVSVRVLYAYILPGEFEGSFSDFKNRYSITLSSLIVCSENEDLFAFGDSLQKTIEINEAAGQIITLGESRTYETTVHFNTGYNFKDVYDETVPQTLEHNENIKASISLLDGEAKEVTKTITFFKTVAGEVGLDDKTIKKAKEAVKDVVSVTSENLLISSYVDKETFTFLKKWIVLVMDLAARPDVSDSVKRAVFDKYSSNGETADVEETITLNLKKNHPGKYVEGNQADFTFRFHVFIVPDIGQYVDSDLNLSNLGSMKDVTFDCLALGLRNELFSASITANVGKFNKAVEDLSVMAKKEVVKAGLDDIFAAYDKIIDACGFVNEEEIVISNAVKSYLYVASEELVTMEETDFISLVRKMWGKDFYDKCKKDINSYHESQENAAHNRKVKIDCPVDVYVYSGDVLVGSVINNQVVPNDLVWGSVVETDGDTKYILDYGYDLTYKIVGYDEGTMNIETYVYQNDDTEGMIEPIKETGYYDLEVTDRIEYTGEIKAETDPLSEDNLICVTKEETIVPDIDTSKGDILVQSISLDQNELVLMKDETAVLTATVLPENATNRQYTWSSSNERVASVDENGTVTAHRRGSAVITARSKNGSYTANCNVTVKVELDDQGDIIDEDIPADGIVPSGLWVSGIPSKNEYTGNKYMFDFRVYDGNKLLSTNADYSVSYKNNVKAYTLKEGEEGFSAKKAPQIIIKAKGNYSGTKTVYFTIDPADITSSDIETLTTAYTGKVQKLSPTVVFEGKTLKKGTDYTLDYPSEGYKEPGTYDITVRGKDNYTGSRIYQMIIGSKDQINLSKAIVSFDKKSYVYDKGNQIMPVITVKNGKTVVDPSLYTVSYGDNNTVGNGTVTITGNDSETIGTRTVTFKITGTPITKLITVTVPKSVTRGTDLKTAVTISSRLTEGTDYQVEYPETENAGKATIVITGINGFTGTIKKTVTVSKDTLTTANTTVTLSETVMMMKNGAKPAPVVTVNGTVLSAGTDYTLSYANNKKAGTGTVTVKGKGNYSGSLKQTFTITAKDLSQTTLEYANNVNSSTKKGSYKTTVVIKDKDGGLLKANTDYTLKFYDGDTEIPATASANDYLGKTLTVKASGKGNYTGEDVLSSEYTVVDSTYNLAKASIVIKPQQYLSGKPVEITSQEQFKKAAMGKKTLTLGTDFKVYSYTNNTARGTATVVFEGMGEYNGYKSVTYKIGQRSIKDYWSGVVSFFSRLMN